MRTPLEAWSTDYPKGPILTHAAAFNLSSMIIDRVHHLPGARVVVADYPLLQHDFPVLRTEHLLERVPRLRTLGPEARDRAIRDLIDRWLVCHAGYISTTQRGQTELNSPIESEETAVDGIRPFAYGRAIVLSLQALRPLPNVDRLGFLPREVTGLLDVKGIGLVPDQSLSRSAHKNGLLFLGEALREMLFANMLERLLVHAGHRARPLPVYAVLDTGFDVIRPNGDPVPAGLLVRRAHLRPHYPVGHKDPGSEAERISLELELLFRRYGLTTTGLDTNLQLLVENGVLRYKYGEGFLDFSRPAQEWILELTGFSGRSMLLEGVNIQFTRGILAEPPDPHFVDMGCFWARQRFVHPMVSLVASRPMRIGTVIHPDHERYTQPDPGLALPWRYWGDTGGIWGYGREHTAISYPLDTPSILCFSLACAFRRGEIDGVRVAERMKDLIATATERW